MTARDSRSTDSKRERQLPAPRPEHAVEPVDALTLYMSELRNYAPVSREEEHLLATRWVEQGDREAGRQLVVANLRLVVKIAMEYRRAWTNVLDLIQEGNLGLLQAVQRFDPTRGTKLSSYAAYWIRAYILKYLIDNIRLVRLGTSRAQRKLFFRLNKEKRELESQGYEVGPKLLAERLDVSEEDVVDMEQRLSESELSLDAPVQEERDSASFGDFIPAGEESVEEQVASSELRSVIMNHVHAFADGLGDRERQIVDRRIRKLEDQLLERARQRAPVEVLRLAEDLTGKVRVKR